MKSKLIDRIKEGDQETRELAERVREKARERKIRELAEKIREKAGS